MFTRIHVLKFQNKVAKDSLKNTCRLINDKLLKRGLYSSTFVDVNDTNLYVINTWKDEKTSDEHAIIHPLRSEGESLLTK